MQKIKFSIFTFSLLLVYLLTGLFSFVLAQKDSVITIPLIEVKSSRQQAFGIGNYVEQVDSNILKTKHSHLGNLLAEHSSVFIKSYGVGSLATPSSRGTGASHTAVLWNGFNLQSPMNGLIDFSLISIPLLDEIDIQMGGNSALSGSGAIGASIHLKDQPNTKQGFHFKLGTSIGSFSHYQNHAKVEFGKGKFSSSLKIFNQQSKNDFPFEDITKIEKPIVKLENAALQQIAILQNNTYRFSKNQTINTHFWYQSTHRKIPPSMTEANSDAQQYDESKRLSLEWTNFIRKKIKATIRTAYFDEIILFDNSSVNNLSQAKSFIVEAESQFQLFKNLLNIGIHHSRYTARSGTYFGNQKQIRSALFLSYKLHALKNKFQVVTNFRQELVDQKTAPFTASIGTTGKLTKQIQISAKISKNYLLPTFNDLYWKGQGAFGNANLKAESSWNQEANIHFKKAFNHFNLSSNIGVFNSKVQNWILWSPNKSGQWTPENKREVWSRGLEAHVDLTWKNNHWLYAFQTQYSMLRSTIEAVYDESNSISLGKQLIYTPHQTGRLHFKIGYKQTLLQYSQQYTGKRFVTSDNKKELDAFFLGNLTLGQEFFLTKKVKVYTSIQINNIWNTSYQNIAWRAMPNRHYQIQFRFNF